MSQLTAVGFDADDTLWQNEKFFRLTENSFTGLLEEFSSHQNLREVLLRTERNNLKRYGYGIKGFILSMIETALEVTQGRVPSAVIQQILDLGKELQAHPIELLPGAREVIETVSRRFAVLLITKGDLLDQERKLAQSGLGDMFDGVEIVSDKIADVYRKAFVEFGGGPDKAMMIGNSVKSDVVPALEAGCWAVLVPHNLTWELEHAETPEQHPRFKRVAQLADVPDLIDEVAFG